MAKNIYILLNKYLLVILRYCKLPLKLIKLCRIIKEAHNISQWKVCCRNRGQFHPPGHRNEIHQEAKDIISFSVIYVHCAFSRSLKKLRVFKCGQQYSLSLYQMTYAFRALHCINRHVDVSSKGNSLVNSQLQTNLASS